MEQWQRNNVAAMLTVILLTAGFSFTIPFLPLYLEGLDNHTPEQAAFWAGVASALGGVGSFVSGPVWGVLGDRFGRKPMLIRAALGGAIGLLAMGLAATTWQLVFFRFWIGVMAGAPAAAMALVASGTPADRLPRSLGSLQACTLLGLAAGPVAGAALIAWLDYRGTFVLTSAVMALGAVTTAVLVREDRTALRRDRAERIADATGAQTGALRELLASPTIRPILLVAMILGCGTPMTQAILPGFTQSLVGDGAVNATVGALFFVIFIASAASAYGAGRLLERLDTTRVLIIGAFAGAGFLAPMGAAQYAWMLFPLVAGMAICQGAIQTSTINLVSGAVDRTRVSTGFGVFQSVQAGVGQAAPAIGGALAAAFGFRSVFPIAAAVLVVAGVSAIRLLPRREPAG